jgi:hypothetical protein
MWGIRKHENVDGSKNNVNLTIELIIIERWI